MNASKVAANSTVMAENTKAHCEPRYVSSAVRINGFLLSIKEKIKLLAKLNLCGINLKQNPEEPNLKFHL